MNAISLQIKLNNANKDRWLQGFHLKKNLKLDTSTQVAHDKQTMPVMYKTQLEALSHQ